MTDELVETSTPIDESKQDQSGPISFLKVLPSLNQQNEVAETIKEATDHNFDEIIFIGFKNGQVYFGSSKTKSVLEQITLLEVAKLERFRVWK